MSARGECSSWSRGSFIVGGQRWRVTFSLQPPYTSRSSTAQQNFLAATSYCGPDLYRLRRHVHAVRRSGESQSQYILADSHDLLFAGVLAGSELSGLARVARWPNHSRIAKLHSLISAGRVGGGPCSTTMRIDLVVAAFGSGLTGTLARRDFYGMGAQGVLPKKFFGQSKPGSDTPVQQRAFDRRIRICGRCCQLLGSAYKRGPRCSISARSSPSWESTSRLLALRRTTPAGIQSSHSCRCSAAGHRSLFCGMIRVPTGIWS